MFIIDLFFKCIRIFHARDFLSDSDSKTVSLLAERAKVVVRLTGRLAFWFSAVLSVDKNGFITISAG